MRWQLTRTIPLALITLFINQGPAAADSSDIRKADNAVSFDFGYSRLSYAETYAGSTLDTEKGWLPTAALGVGLLANDNAGGLVRNLYLHLEGRASVGSTQYDGSACDIFGNCTSIQGSTNDQIYSAAVQMGSAFPVGPAVLLTPFAEIGYRHWNREGQGAGGYDESYSNWDAMGGLLAQYSPVERWVLSLSGAGGTTFSARNASYFPNPAGESLPLGNETIWRVQGKLGYRLTGRLELTGTAEFQGFGYGASRTDAYGYMEPASMTHQATLLTGIAYHFF